MQKESVISYYYRIAITLKNRIHAGEYDQVHTIPSEKDLASEFEVSEVTIRKALGILVDEGWIVRKRGVGTMIIPQGDHLLPLNITGNFRDWFDTASGRFPKHLGTEVLDISIAKCPERIMEILSIPSNEKVWQMKRLRKLNGEPISYYINYASRELMEHFESEIYLEKTVFELLQEMCKNGVSKIDQKVETISADLDICTVLEIDFGDPIFLCENTYWAGGRAVELSRIFYRGDRYLYHAAIDIK